MDTITSAQDASRVPAPPPKISDDTSILAEVVIRTMASDLASLGESGGLGTRGETVAVRLLATQNLSAPGPRYSRIIVWTLMVLAGIGFLFLVGYYFIPALAGGTQ